MAAFSKALAVFRAFDSGRQAEEKHQPCPHRARQWCFSPRYNYRRDLNNASGNCQKKRKRTRWLPDRSQAMPGRRPVPCQSAEAGQGATMRLGHDHVWELPQALKPRVCQRIGVDAHQDTEARGCASLLDSERSVVEQDVVEVNDQGPVGTQYADLIGMLVDSPIAQVIGRRARRGRSTDTFP